MSSPIQFKLNFTGGLSLIYDITTEPIGALWANLIKNRNVEECCKINHFMGWKTDEVIQQKISRLYELADHINSYVPTKVIKAEINRNTWRVALHNMHVHFPEMKNDEAYQEIWASLTEYNDTIHWLEAVLMTAWTKDQISESSLLRLTLDFNKTVFEFYDIPDGAFKLFSPFSEFGDIFLHYTHVGKHTFEMFGVNDFECPKHQFVPQRTFNASVRISFYDYFYPDDKSKQALMDRWNKFYYDKGGIDYWGIDINDPKIAFGYCRIGKLSEILEDNISVKIPITMAELNQFRSKLIEKSVIDWEIKGA